MPYLNVDEVESAVELVAQSNTGFTELIDLPRPTWEGRTSRAIRVHQGTAAAEGIYLLGGVHAREWEARTFSSPSYSESPTHTGTEPVSPSAASPSPRRISVALLRQWKSSFSRRPIPTAGATR